MKEEGHWTKVGRVILYVAVYFSIFIIIGSALNHIDKMETWKVVIRFLIATSSVIGINWIFHFRMKTYPFLVSVLLMCTHITLKFMYIATYSLSSHYIMASIKMYLRSSETISMYFLLYLLFLDMIVNILLIKIDLRQRVRE